MAQNPYAVPEQMGPNPELINGYISLKWLSILATAGLILFSIADFAVTALNSAGSLMFDTFNDLDAAPSSETECLLLIGLTLFALILVVAFIFNIVVICMFMYRANANARALGAQGMENSPGWCGGYWFIPILNLFKPYKCMDEIHRASQKSTGTQWKSYPAHYLIGPWWGAWLVGNILTNFVTRGETSGLLNGDTVAMLNWITTALLIGAAAMLIVILRSITSLQNSQYNQQ